MMIGRLSCGRFAPGSGRVVVVRSLRSWLPTRERPLEPLSWPRRLLARLLARKAFSSLLEGSRGGTSKQEAPPPGNQWQAPTTPVCSAGGCRTKRQPTAKPLARTRTQAAEEGLPSQRLQTALGKNSSF